MRSRGAGAGAGAVARAWCLPDELGLQLCVAVISGFDNIGCSISKRGVQSLLDQ
jgi:hypothetical protein